MSNQTTYSLVPEKLVDMYMELPQIGLLDLTHNSYRFFNASSPLLGVASTRISSIDLAHNQLEALDICAIERRVEAVKEADTVEAVINGTANATTRVYVNLYPQHTELDKNWHVICAFFDQIKKSNDLEQLQVPDCSTIYNNFYGSGACRLIEEREPEWTRFSKTYKPITHAPFDNHSTRSSRRPSYRITRHSTSRSAAKVTSAAARLGANSFLARFYRFIFKHEIPIISTVFISSILFGTWFFLVYLVT